MFLKEIFSKRVLELRNQKGLNQETFGKAVGIKKQTVSMIEKGHRGVSVEIICAIADYFNVSLDYLTGRKDTPEM